MVKCGGWVFDIRRHIGLEAFWQIPDRAVVM